MRLLKYKLFPLGNFCWVNLHKTNKCLQKQLITLGCLLNNDPPVSLCNSRKLKKCLYHQQATVSPAVAFCIFVFNFFFLHFHSLTHNFLVQIFSFFLKKTVQEYNYCIDLTKINITKSVTQLFRYKLKLTSVQYQTAHAAGNDKLTVSNPLVMRSNSRTELSYVPAVASEELKQNMFESNSVYWGGESCKYSTFTKPPS